MSYGWQKFSTNPGPTLVPVIIGSVIQVVCAVVLWTIFIALLWAALSTTTTDGYYAESSGPSFVAVFVILNLLYLGVILVHGVLYGGWVKAALEVARGNSPTLTEAYTGWSKVDILALTLLLGLTTSVPGFIVGQIPAIGPLLFLAWVGVVFYVAQFAPLFLVGCGYGVVESVKASYELIRTRHGEVLLLDLFMVGAFLAGLALCGLGTFVAVPVALTAHAYAFLKFRQEPVAP